MTRRYLLDSGPAFDFLFKRKGVDIRAKDARRRGARVGICVPVLGEIIGGLEASASREKSSWAIARPRLAKLVLWPYERPAAFEYGRIYADLEKRGKVIQQIDIQIAAIAIALGDCTVVSSDTDLSRVLGLKIEDWTK